LIERDSAAIAGILLPVGAKKRGTSQCKAHRQIQIPDSEVTGKVFSEVLFSFPALCFDAFSPDRSSRYCGAPKPGKEKDKRYDYRSAILIAHMFESFLCVFPPYCVRFGARLREKFASRG
jgi:hypothetical protein